MKIVEAKREEYLAWKEKNADDPYGACCFAFAEAWAEEIEARIAAAGPYRTVTVADVAKDACSVVDRRPGFGITGFMYGMAVSILSKTWEYGEELRRWHNIDTQIGKEGEKANETGGVLNPALLSIGGDK